MKRIVLLLSLLTAMGIAASAQQLSVGGRQWKLTQLNGSPVEISMTYLAFDPDQTRFTGNAGCNRMFGAVEIRGRRIAFGDIGTTRMACRDPKAQSTEIAFLAELKKVDGFRRSGNTLELLKGRGVRLKFVGTMNSDRNQDAARLEDKKWVLDSIGSSATSKLGRTAFIVFDRDKASAGGNSSCNVFGGSYSASGGSLKITELISTMRACIEDERMDIERQFLDGLRETDRYKIQNDKLMLYRDNRLLLTLTGEAK